jgi:hypothetical protein
MKDVMSKGNPQANPTFSSFNKKQDIYVSQQLVSELTLQSFASLHNPTPMILNLVVLVMIMGK